MHIVLFFTFDISLKHWKDAGLLEREVKIYKEIAEKNNFRYTFITYGDKSDIDIEGLPKNLKIIPAYSLINYSENKLLRFFSSFKIPFLLKKEISDVNIIKTNQLNGSWVAIIYKLLTRKKLIIRTGFNAYNFAKLQKKSLIIRTGYFVLTQIALMFSNLFTVTSKCDKGDLSESFYLAKKIKVRPNWVYLNNNSFNTNRHRKRILSVGRLEKQKNYEFLIRSFENSEYILDIVGDGSLKKDLLLLSKECNVNLNLLGNLGNDELINLYSEYRYFLIPSLYEGNPKVVLEAMAAGCVVVGTRIESLQEIIDNGKNGFLFTPFKEELLGLIEKLNNNKELSNISINAIKSIEANNSIEKLMNFELQDYKDLV
tara:strand:+ start:48 stop:1160 length:1113 start_codon:yes stop_codon:yes gene_type:complete